MVGDALLVAPMFAGDAVRSVILPAGRWYDFYTGALVGGGQVITAKPGLSKIPLYVRDGGIIPLLAEARRQVPRAGEQVDLEVRHYGETPGSFALYDDDGTTFAYERGEFSWTTLFATRDVSAPGSLRGDARRPPAGKPFSYREIRWTRWWRDDTSVIPRSAATRDLLFRPA